MSVVLINDSTLTDIADAIREQNGTQTTYLPGDMADAIAAIEGGGGTIPDITISNSHYAFAGPVVATLWPLIKSKIHFDYSFSGLGSNIGELFAQCQIEDLSDITVEIGTTSVGSNPAYNMANLFVYSKAKYLPSLALGDWDISPTSFFLNWTNLFSNSSDLE